MIFDDYKGLNRSLKRKVNDARKKQMTEITLNVDYLANVSKCLDALVFEKEHPPVFKWVKADE